MAHTMTCPLCGQQHPASTTYCMTMLVDGLKDEKAENVQVKDVAELVAEVLGQG